MKIKFFLLLGSLFFLFSCAAYQQDLKVQNQSLEWRLENLESSSLAQGEELRKNQKELRELKDELKEVKKSLATLEEKVLNFSKLIEKEKKDIKREEQDFKEGPSPQEELLVKLGKVENKEQFSDKDWYEQGLNLILQGKYKQGRETLKKIEENYPESKLMPNVLYWIGESYYGDELYAQSILTFKRVISGYPKSYKAAHALLKIAYAYLELGDKENAKFYLKVLLEDYPKSDVVEKAKAKLKSLG